MRNTGMRPQNPVKTLMKLGFVCIVVCVSNMAFGSGLTIINADFLAIPVTCGNGFAYQIPTGIGCQQDFNGTAGFGWTLAIANGIGLTKPNTAFNPPDPTGMPFQQALFLQGAPTSAFQSVAGFNAGDYVLSFYLGSRYAQNDLFDGTQTLQAMIDGTVIGTWALTSFTPFTLEHAAFVVPTGGAHTVEFSTINSGDHTLFLSGISISQPVPEPVPLALLSTGVLCLPGLKRRLL